MHRLRGVRKLVAWFMSLSTSPEYYDAVKRQTCAMCLDFPAMKMMNQVSLSLYVLSSGILLKTQKLTKMPKCPSASVMPTASLLSNPREENDVIFC